MEETYKIEVRHRGKKRRLGEFKDPESAAEACRHVAEEFFASYHGKGSTALDIYRKYKGDDPPSFEICRWKDAPDVPFGSETYARELCRKLADKPSEIHLLVEAYRETDWHLWEFVAEEITRLGDEAIPLLIGALQDPEDQVRWRVADLLGKIGLQSPEVVQALLKMVRRRNESDRRAAARFLGRMIFEFPGVAEALLEGLMRLQDKIMHQTRAKDSLARVKERALAG